MKQRVLVCGGRAYHDQNRVFSILDATHAANPIIEVIHGGCAGADMLAAKWAAKHGIPERQFKADWDAHGPAAGPIRNRKMLDEGKPDIVVAFPGHKGTRNMIEQAEGANVPVARIRK